MAKSVVSSLEDIKKGLDDILKKLNVQIGMPIGGSGGQQQNQQSQGQQGDGQGQGQGNQNGQGNGQGQNNQNGQNGNGAGNGQGNGPKDIDDMLNRMGENGRKIKENRKHLSEKANTMEINGTKIDTSKDNIRDVKINENDKGKSPQTVENTINSLVQIAQNSEEWGNDSCGGLRSLIESMNKNYVNWLVFLKHFLKKDKSKDKTYFKYHNTRVFRMTDGNGPILRGNRAKKERLRGLLIAIDTSGSINDDKLINFLGDVKGLLNDHPHIEGHLIYWGTDVASAGKFKKKSDIDDIQVGYGGGTDVECVFKYAQDNPDIKHIVIYTDGYFSKSNLAKYANKWKPVVWVLWDKSDYDEFEVPFGYKCI